MLMATQKRTCLANICLVCGVHEQRGLTSERRGIGKAELMVIVAGVLSEKLPGVMALHGGVGVTQAVGHGDERRGESRSISPAKRCGPITGSSITP